MRIYHENWNYTLTSSSTPYNYNSGIVNFTGGQATFDFNSFISKDNYGAQQFYGNNYSGNYVIQFDIDESRASLNTYFVSLCYGVPSFTPAIAYTDYGIRLTWGAYNYFDNFCEGTDAGNVPNAALGDFNGQIIDGFTGTWIIMKKPAGIYSYVAAHFISSAGMHYKSGWNYVYDPYSHNQLGFSNRGGFSGWVGWPGRITISSLLVVDQLTDAEIAAILDTGATPGGKPIATIVPTTGTYHDMQLVAIATTGDTTGWSLYYTTDGTTPTNASPLYTAAFDEWFDPLNDHVVQAVYYNSTTSEYSSVSTVIYHFEVISPSVNYSHGHSFYTDALLYLIQSSSDVQTYYTVDGSDPTTNGILYVPGVSKIVFDSWDAASANISYIEIPIEVVNKHIASGAWSATITGSYTFYCAAPEITVQQGVHYSSIDMQVVCQTPNSKIFYYVGDLVQYTTAVKTQIANPSTLHAPWQYGQKSYVFTSLDANGTLNGGPVQVLLDFEVAAPTLTPSYIISNDPADILITCATPDVTIYHTLDGSIPDASSLVSTGTITVNAGTTLKTVAYVGESKSLMSYADILPEYEVKNIATVQMGQTRYHYYESAQRCELISDLSASLNSITDLNAVSTASVQVNDDAGNAHTIFVWDTHGSMTDNSQGWNGSVASLIIRNGQYVKHASRFCFTSDFNVTANLSINQYVTQWLSEAYSPICIKAISRNGILAATIRNNGSNFVCIGSVDYLDRQSNPSNTNVSVAIPSTMLPIVISGTSSGVSISIGGSTICSMTGDLSAGWHVEIGTGVDGATSSMTPPPTSLACIISTVAAEAVVRRIPISLVGPMHAVEAGSTSTVSKSVFMQFNEPLDPLAFKFATDSVTPYIGWSREHNALSMVGYYGWVECTQWSIDTTQDFSVIVDMEALIPTANVTTNYRPEFAIELAEAGTNQNWNIGSSTSINTIFDVMYDGAKKFSKFSTSTFGSGTRVNMRHRRSFKMKLQRVAGVMKSMAWSEGLWIDLGTITGSLIGQAHLYFKFRDGMDSMHHTRWIVNSVSINGMLSRNRMTPSVTGLDIKLDGKGYGFNATSLSDVAPNTVGMLVLDRTTGHLLMRSMQFESTDTQFIVGVYESDEFGLLSWTPTVSSSLIRCRTETSDGLSDGKIIAVGHDLRIKDHQVTWIESGIERTRAIGNLDWQAPSNAQRGWTTTRLIRGVDRPRMNISIVSGRS